MLIITVNEGNKMIRFLNFLKEVIGTFVKVFLLVIVFIVIFCTILFYLFVDTTTSKGFYNKNHKQLNNLVYQIKNNPNNTEQVLNEFDWMLLNAQRKKRNN
jgi:hypothetical protein